MFLIIQVKSPNVDSPTNDYHLKFSPTVLNAVKHTEKIYIIFYSLQLKNIVLSCFLLSKY